ncbi:ORF6N domain-containing protein [Halodesulfovibrio sp.]|uniref:ORF6N domain-containing protein n=1 Tax=Halodesulfovibrio sp. TaxID=1912772 RepID=UPI0025D702D5|nr:ORF6N domain-containing protein [Halodesulfovibrio sp.]MCT4533726.1 ORF6N domain-containing protein [Halodesulfovibrio sp.]
MSTEKVVPITTNELDIETCEPLMYMGLPVVPTQLLAKLYGCDSGNIQRNFNRNAERFKEGKHYFKIEGDDLRQLKNHQTDCPMVKIASNASWIIFWTERGAARHAKMLETDAAWDVFEKLEDAYFNRTPSGNITADDECTLLSRYAELHVISSLTIAMALKKEHGAVLEQIHALNLPSDMYHSNFLYGEQTVNNRERISVVAMTQTGFGILMQQFSGKRAKDLLVHAMNNFSNCEPSPVVAFPINAVSPRVVKRRPDAKRMLALRGALKIYAAVEGRTYKDTEAELCSYLVLSRIEDIGAESYELAMEYVFGVINRPASLISPPENPAPVSAATLRGALDLWAYYGDSKTYSEVMAEFEAETGIRTLNEVDEKNCLRLLLVIWGKVTAGLARRAG